MPVPFAGPQLAALRRLLRLAFVFILPPGIVLGLLAAGVFALVQPMLRNNSDLEQQLRFVAHALEDPVNGALASNDNASLRRLLNQLTRDSPIVAIAVCDAPAHVLAASDGFPADVGCGDRTDSSASVHGSSFAMWGRSLRVHHVDIPVHADALLQTRPSAAGALGTAHSQIDQMAPRIELLVIRNPASVRPAGEETQRYLLWLFVGSGISLALITTLLANWSWRTWVDGVRHILRSGDQARSMERAAPEIQPLLGDLRRLLRSVHEDRRILKDTTIEWRPETLKLLLREHLFGDEVIVVSNREPYIHELDDKGELFVRRPASGLVTAIEPVMRACSGIWVAHGSGSADADVVNAASRIEVPPHAPGEPPARDAYTLRRVWLSEEEERGYYFGFSNEGLWPLCHIAHVRPVFREEDWRQYQAVNARFADAVVAEARTDNPVVLVQDYHFALLPKLLRERLPRATIITFWHIPWPNPESFGICPWAREILEGLLGSTILGFHTRYHCQNFLETVDRFLESRISREDTSVVFQGRRTKVRDYPISIHWDAPGADPQVKQLAARQAVRARHGLPADHHIVLGVDRLDYTKGIVERMLAVERLLDQHPGWVGKVSLIQIAAPSRSSLEQYHRFELQVREIAQRINDKFAPFAPAPLLPIILLIEQHDSDSVHEHYLATDVALVTSLHDGMNLVAKEFVAARETENGVLILSRFAGAAAEMPEALIVNPYHVGAMAEALDKALTMHPLEQRERMRAMRRRLADFNIYRWAGAMLLDAADERRHERIQDRIGQAEARAQPSRFPAPWRRRAERAAQKDSPPRTTARQRTDVERQP